jgi:hypothetical protein
MHNVLAKISVWTTKKQVFQRNNPLIALLMPLMALLMPLVALLMPLVALLMPLVALLMPLVALLMPLMALLMAFPCSADTTQAAGPAQG